MFVSALVSLSAPAQSVWKPAGDRIMTRWAADIDPASPLPEYPRPQMVRGEWRSLNGLWDYAVTSADASAPESFDGQILVPFCIESALSGVGRRMEKDEVLWYDTTFTVPPAWRGRRVLLNFGAVDYLADVYVNEIFVGRHKGGYTSFSIDITDALFRGASQHLRIRVEDGTDNGLQPRGKQVTNPGGIWYTPVTGIWQSVWMECVGEAHISNYLVVSDIDAGTLHFSASVDGKASGCSLLAEVYDKGVKIGDIAFSPNGSGAVVRLSDMHLWSPEDPYLYDIKLKLFKDGRLIDSVNGYTACRKSSEVRDSAGYRRIGLNNKPYFQFGPLDQGWWPDGLYTAPSDEALRNDILVTKELGYNMIRKHIKVEPARWYYWCDVLGVTVWQDMPSLTGNLGGQWGEWGYDQGFDYPLAPEAKRSYYNEWGDIIRQLSNFPCIVVWVPFNEAWSQFDTPAVVAFTRALDPSRLINSASGGNSHHCGDILDSHNYPDPVMKFRSGGSQIDVLGEYGGIGWPVEGHLWSADRNWGYIGYSSGEEVLAQYESYASQLMEQVASGVSAAVYTQTTDVEIEVNGLMTYDREIVKMDAEKLAEINKKVIDSARKE